MMSKAHRLDLLNNSISYFKEAVSYLQRDTAAEDRRSSVISPLGRRIPAAWQENEGPLRAPGSCL
jgi:hypothetical protein